MSIVQTNSSIERNSSENLEADSLRCPVCEAQSSRGVVRAPDRFHGRTALYELNRCSSCDLVWLANAPSPDEMSHHYGHQYHNSITAAGEEDIMRRWERQRRTVLNLKSQGKILDIGCSSGAFLRILPQSGWDLYGIEISRDEAETARRSSGAEVFIGDPLDAPFEPETFDVITCFHLLEHVYDPVALLRRIGRWLKPSGFLYVIVPNIASWEARLFGSHWYGLELPRHLFHFSPSSLVRIAQLAGLGSFRIKTEFEDSFSEHSCHYICEDLMLTCGIKMRPLAAGIPASLPVKVVRKAFRISIESLFRYAAGIAGSGASIDGIFVKQ